MMNTLNVLHRSNNILSSDSEVIYSTSLKSKIQTQSLIAGCAPDTVDYKLRESRHWHRHTVLNTKITGSKIIYYYR